MKLNITPKGVHQLILVFLVLLHFIFMYITDYHSWEQFLFLFVSLLCTFPIYDFIRKQDMYIGQYGLIKLEQKTSRVITLISLIFLFILCFGVNINNFLENI